jgi:tRNA threonylcarbamoyl adenosine modification protein YjeE
VRAAVAELHGSEEGVSSPTFVFRQRYDGTPPVEHVDLYRIDDALAELPELGLEDAFASDRIAFVEWAERAAGWLPRRRIDVTIEGVGEGPRVLRIARTT